MLGCRKVIDRREANGDAGPLQYMASGDVFDDAKSYRSLSEYDGTGFEIGTLDSKEAVVAVSHV